MNKDLTVKKTTYTVQGSVEPCFEVTNGYAMVRIAPYYHYRGSDELIITEYLDGEWNDEDVWSGNFNTLTEDKAIQIAKSYSVYLN